MDLKKTLISVSFILFGILCINYALTRQCDIGAITQTVGNVTATVNQPVQMNRMICMSTDAYAVIAMLLGAASVFPGVGGLHSGLTEKKNEKKS